MLAVALNSSRADEVECIHPCDEDPGSYDDVRLLAPTRWSLCVSFVATGTYSIRGEALGIDAPTRPPVAERSTPKARKASKGIVLNAGRNTEGTQVGESTWDDARERLGPAPGTQTWSDGTALNVVPKGLSVVVEPDGEVKRISTVRGFAGRTDRSIRHGDTRARVLEVMGVPRRQFPDAWWWTYPGIAFRFDGWDCVDAIKVVP